MDAVATWSSDVATVVVLSDELDDIDEMTVTATVMIEDSPLKVPVFRDAHGRVSFRFLLKNEGHVAFIVRSATEVWTCSVSVGAVSQRWLAPRIKVMNRRFATDDGAPFLWIGDTVWMAMTGRIDDAEWVEIVTDRAQKGFTVMQVVLGFPPDSGPEDQWTDNAGGPAWDQQADRPNAAFFDVVDGRIAAMLNAGLVPCVFGAWGFHLQRRGPAAMLRHWHALVARYWAYPITWCLAGEALMPEGAELGTEAAPLSAAYLRDEWYKIARHIAAIDPGQRILTAHPSIATGHFSTFDMFPDEGVFTLNMLQTGHSDRLTAEFSLGRLADAIAEHAQPVVNGEVCYEGIMGSNYEDVQRFVVYTHLLAGAAGHTYGSHGLWALDGAGPDVPDAGAGWGSGTWREGLARPGGAQVGAARSVLESADWFTAQPAVGLVSPEATPETPWFARAAQSASGARVLYFPSTSFLPLTTEESFGPGRCLSLAFSSIGLLALVPHARYEGTYIDPRTGRERERFEFTADGSGEHWRSTDYVNSNPTLEDWVLTVRPA